MTTMASIVVKKHDNTTDITYGIKTAAGGDGAWAIWRQDLANTDPPIMRPTFASRVVESKAGVRRVDIMFTYPDVYTDANTGQRVSTQAITFRNGVWTVPQGISATAMNEASAQFVRLVDSAMTRAGLADQTSFN